MFYSTGTYQPSPGEASCEPCPSGFYCVQNTTNPELCPEYSYCPENTSDPILCPNGTYSTAAPTGHQSADDCAQCPAGKWVIYLLHSSQIFIQLPFSINPYKTEGAQWLSGRVLDSSPRGPGFKPHRRHCVLSLSKNINPSLVLVQPRKTCPYMTERLLMGRKKSNQTKNI